MHKNPDAYFVSKQSVNYKFHIPLGNPTNANLLMDCLVKMSTVSQLN